MVTLTGNTSAIVAVRELIKRAAGADCPVLITGESGTGKEVAARMIWKDSRATMPFLACNCGAIPRDLVESTLFGHVKGAFTGATKDQPGLFRAAGGGIVFLDEVIDLPVDMQVKLLRVLQEREVVPVGSYDPIPIECRVLAATNSLVQRALEERRLREDLYFRLNVLEIHLPPLREHADDILALVNQFLSQAKEGGRVRIIDSKALTALMKYHWPGNIRELENVIERAIVLSDRIIELRHLSNQVIMGFSPTWYSSEMNWRRKLEEVERQHILNVFIQTGRKHRETADILDINTSTLYRRLLGWGITEKQKDPDDS
jgi:two-component system response regulator PilR (NtrC family)